MYLLLGSFIVIWSRIIPNFIYIFLGLSSTVINRFDKLLQNCNGPTRRPNKRIDNCYLLHHNFIINLRWILNCQKLSPHLYFEMLINIAIFLFILQVAYSGCPNFCSGHGKCNTDNTCECFEGYEVKTDCSQRKL